MARASTSRRSLGEFDLDVASSARVLRVGGLSLAYFGAALLGILLTREAGGIATVWPPNAILLAVLWRSNLRSWPLYLAGCAVANLAANLIFGDGLVVALGLALVNMAEVLVGVFLALGFLGGLHRLDTVKYALGFWIFAGLAAPLFGATGAAGLVHWAYGAPFWSVWTTWWIADAMGMVIVGPVFLSFSVQRIHDLKLDKKLAEVAFLLTAAFVLTYIVFSQPNMLLLFTVPPLLVWGGFRLGLFETTLSCLLVSAVAVSCTILGSGPFAEIAGMEEARRILTLQTYLATTTLAPAFVALTLLERRRSDRALGRRQADLEAANQALAVAVEEREILLKELQHRVKNNLQVVVSLLNLRSDRLPDGAAKQTIAEASNRVTALALAHRFLYQPDSPGALSVRDYIRELCATLGQVYAMEPDQVEIETDVENLQVPVDKLAPVALVLNELISNGLKHAFPEGRRGRMLIRLRKVVEDDGTICVDLKIADNGVGLPEDFELEDPAYIGLKVLVGLVHQLDGRIEVQRSRGATFHIRFPL